MTHSEHDQEDDRPNINLSRVEQEDAEERAGPSTTVVYASIAARGVEELRRPFSGLWWSGISAGIVLSTSVLAEGLLHYVLPPFEGVHAITDIGYTLGFIIVILGRMQLFTESTITPVLPLLTNPTRTAIWRLLRLWLVVLVANLVGAFVGAWLLARGSVVTPEQMQAVVEVSSKILDITAFETLRYGIIAGFLIAALVWLIPTARSNEFLVILFITYVIALGDFTHVVAGSAEAFILWFEGRAGLEWVFLGFIGPALVGNMLGGTVIFSLLAYAQVREEIAESKFPDRDPFAPMKSKRDTPKPGEEAAAPPPVRVERKVRGHDADAERAKDGSRS